MNKEKTPPPDHPGNIRGRMKALLSVTRRKFIIQGLEGEALEKAVQKACSKKMKKLETRLKKVEHLAKPIKRKKKKTLKQRMEERRKKQQHTGTTDPKKPAAKKSSKKATKKKTKKKKSKKKDEEIASIIDLLNEA